MQDVADIDSFHQDCHHIDPRLFDKGLEAPESFATVFLYSTIGSPCWTESDSQQSTDTPSQDISTTWEADMTASWSSVATGKPQLSYAERLRKAKEGSSKLEIPSPAPPPYADVDSTSVNGGDSRDSPRKQSEQGQKSEPAASPTSVVPALSAVQSTSTPASKAGGAGESSPIFTAESSTSGTTVVNVWEARKKLQQERERAKEEEKERDNSSAAVEDLPKLGGSSEAGKEQSTSYTRVTKASTSKFVGKGEEPKTKKKRGAASTSDTKIGNTTVLPSIADANAWPSPDKSISVSSKAEAIVPTITHTASLPATPTKTNNKATVSSPATSSANGPTSPTTFTRRHDQKRPSPLPINTQVDNGRSAAMSINSDATLLQSPSNDLRGLSPRLARMALNNQAMQSLAASPRRNHSSSPLRSPSLANGSVRGPRFSGDIKSPKEAHSWLQPLGSDDLPLEFAGQSGAEASSNALRLSDGTGDAVSLPMTESRTRDGSYPPIRASASAFSPTGQPLLQQASTSGHPSSATRSQSSVPSPRGSRGRGKMSKTSDGHSAGESSGSRNDTEERGLPSDVPSGPRRQQNGDGTPPREGGSRGYSSGSYRRGPFQQHAPPYAMYGQPPPGSFFYPTPAQLQPESTPGEFAPKGDATKSEPSEALLHQIEFYFSHRNLEGDFYLRKNMDSQGFVPIQVVANFNKVKKMTDKVDIIKETLLFSKVLYVDAERDLVRKGIDWHLYTLIDGERPQQNIYQSYSPQQPLPHFVSPPPLPPFAQTSPPYPSYYGRPAQPFYFSPPYNQNTAPLAPGDKSSYSQQQAMQQPSEFTDGQHSNGEASGENIFGVIAAEGLAAERRPE